MVAFKNFNYIFILCVCMCTYARTREQPEGISSSNMEVPRTELRKLQWEFTAMGMSTFLKGHPAYMPKSPSSTVRRAGKGQALQPLLFRNHALEETTESKRPSVRFWVSRFQSRSLTPSTETSVSQRSILWFYNSAQAVENRLETPNSNRQEH